MQVKPAVEEKHEILNRSPALFALALHRLAEAILKRDVDLERRRVAELAQLLGETMALADVLGRRRSLLESDAFRHGRGMIKLSMHDLMVARFGKTPVFPRVEFREAYEDIVSRDARLVKTAEDVRRAYSVEHGFALLRVPRILSEQARLTLTKRIQQMLAGYIERGEKLGTIREQLADIGGFTKAYAETVYRTNLGTAYTAGRMAQFRDPEVADIVPAFEYTAVRDASVRPNHLAADGFIAGLDHVEWARIAPPNGWNCRCDLRAITKGELRARGLLARSGHVQPWYPPEFRNARPDPGFRHQKPDFSTYG